MQQGNQAETTPHSQIIKEELEKAIMEASTYVKNVLVFPTNQTPEAEYRASIQTQFRLAFMRMAVAQIYEGWRNSNPTLPSYSLAEQENLKLVLFQDSLCQDDRTPEQHLREFETIFGIDLSKQIQSAHEEQLEFQPCV